MKAVVVRLMGGLGNQMFQYATAKALALRIGAELQLDLSWFGNDPNRQFALGSFAIKAHLQKQRKRKPQGNNLYTRVLRKFGFPREKQGIPVFRETSALYDPMFEKIQQPVFLDGYFQSENYFVPFRQQIMEEFIIREEPSPAASQILRQILSTDAIALHIRRGDYVTNPIASAYHGTCSLDYYHAGLDRVTEGLSKPHCFVFSDDPYWVRENFKPNIPMTLVDIHRTDQAHEDLRLMMTCQKFVIANSSLSWWGAWLSSCDGKKVVAPLNWYQNSDKDTSDLIPKTWLRL